MDAVNRLCLVCGEEYSGCLRVCPKDQTVLVTVGQDKRVGTILNDNYDILEVIGSGGMGTVYKARQRMMNKIVAVKLLHEDLISSADALKRFQFEAQAASRLNHLHILTIFDFGISGDGQPFMVMDYLDGTSLEDLLLAENHIEPLRAINIFMQACTALSHAHKHDVLHRDIKPSNIMLIDYDNQKDFVKIVDFSIAKLMNQTDGQGMQLTRSGEVHGSPAYMSPEQCRGVELDQRSDVYSLGCVMYRTLTGHSPMQSDGVLQSMLKHINEVPPHFAEICPQLQLPDMLEQAVFRSLSKDPSQRYQTMDLLRDRLEKVRDAITSDYAQKAKLQQADPNLYAVVPRHIEGGAPIPAARAQSHSPPPSQLQSPPASQLQSAPPAAATATPPANGNSPAVQAAPATQAPPPRTPSGPVKMLSDAVTPVKPMPAVDTTSSATANSQPTALVHQVDHGSSSPSSEIPSPPVAPVAKPNQTNGGNYGDYGEQRDQGNHTDHAGHGNHADHGDYGDHSVSAPSHLRKSLTDLDVKQAEEDEHQLVGPRPKKNLVLIGGISTLVVVGMISVIAFTLGKGPSQNVPTLRGMEQDKHSDGTGSSGTSDNAAKSKAFDPDAASDSTPSDSNKTQSQSGGSAASTEGGPIVSDDGKQNTKKTDSVPPVEPAQNSGTEAAGSDGGNSENKTATDGTGPSATLPDTSTGGQTDTSAPAKVAAKKEKHRRKIARAHSTKTAQAPAAAAPTMPPHRHAYSSYNY